MTVTVNDNPIVVRRCPVCKIDRKGRFILANQQAQGVFGLTEVELFGRPFVDFVQPSDRPAFLQLIRNRNPYETTFDSACLNLVDSKGQAFPVTVIVSVNFGGGNPANYQVIIRPIEALAINKAAQPKDSSWEDMTRLLLDDNGDLTPDALVSSLHALTGVASVAIHDLTQPECPTVTFAGLGAAVLPPLDSAFSPEIAISEEHRCETLPNEVRATFSLTGDRPLLARFILIPPGAGEIDGAVRTRAEMAAGLLHSVRPPILLAAPDAPRPQESVSFQDVFDGLGCGFVRLDSRDHVVEHNSAFDAWFPMPDSLTDLRALLEAIACHSGEEKAAAIANHLAASAGLEEPPGFRGHLVLNSGTELELEISLLNNPSGDRSTYLVFRDSDNRQARGATVRGLSLRAGSAALDLLKSSIAATTGVWQKIEHEHHNELSRDGGFYLSCMSHNIDTLAGTIADLERMLKLVGEIEEPQIVDLQLLIDRQVEETIRACPTLTFAVRNADLLKITGPLRKLTAILRDVLMVCAAKDSEKAREVAITATAENGNCTILVCDNGPGMTTREIKNLFRLRRQSPGDPSLKQPGLDFGLSLASEIASSLGGSLTVQSQSERGTAFKIQFPLNQPS
jgi:PAS domain S-box-containing protein